MSNIYNASQPPPAPIGVTTSGLALRTSAPYPQTPAERAAMRAALPSPKAPSQKTANTQRSTISGSALDKYGDAKEAILEARAFLSGFTFANELHFFQKDTEEWERFVWAVGVVYQLAQDRAEHLNKYRQITVKYPPIDGDLILVITYLQATVRKEVRDVARDFVLSDCFSIALMEKDFPGTETNIARQYVATNLLNRTLPSGMVPFRDILRSDGCIVFWGSFMFFKLLARLVAERRAVFRADMMLFGPTSFNQGTICFVYYLVQTSLDEWKSGTYIEQKLDVQKDEKNYKTVVRELQEFRRRDPVWATEFDNMREFWWSLAMQIRLLGFSAEQAWSQSDAIAAGLANAEASVGVARPGPSDAGPSKTAFESDVLGSFIEDSAAQAVEDTLEPGDIQLDQWASHSAST